MRYCVDIDLPDGKECDETTPDKIAYALREYFGLPTDVEVWEDRDAED